MDDELDATIAEGASQSQGFLRAAVPAMGLCLLGFFALLIDLPVARWFIQYEEPDLLEKLAQLSEVFGHGLGVAIFLTGIWILDANHRRCLPRVALCCFGAGLFSDVFKLMLSRVRPHHFDFHGGVGSTFLEWFPGLGSSIHQSFPSSHSATALGFALGLAHIYPRGRAYFVTLALFSVFQRIIGGSHYVSDACWGAALGCLTVALLYHDCYLAPRFNAWEAAGNVVKPAAEKPELPLSLPAPKGFRHKPRWKSPANRPR